VIVGEHVDVLLSKASVQVVIEDEVGVFERIGVVRKIPGVVFGLPTIADNDRNTGVDSAERSYRIRVPLLQFHGVLAWSRLVQEFDTNEIW
jgi:hypothetical protein